MLELRDVCLSLLGVRCCLPSGNYHSEQQRDSLTVYRLQHYGFEIKPDSIICLPLGDDSFDTYNEKYGYHF